METKKEDLELKTNVIVQFSIHILFATNIPTCEYFFNLNNNDIYKTRSLFNKHRKNERKKSQFSYLNYVLDFFCISNDNKI